MVGRGVERGGEVGEAEGLRTHHFLYGLAVSSLPRVLKTLVQPEFVDIVSIMVVVITIFIVIRPPRWPSG